MMYNKDNMNFMKKNWQKLVLAAFILLLPIISFAAGDPDCTLSSGKICNPLGTTQLVPELIRTILEGVLKIGIPIVALAVIYCGFLFVSARGKPEAITKAKDALLYTLIGAAILLGSWAIAQMISATVFGLGS